MRTLAAPRALLVWNYLSIRVRSIVLPGARCPRSEGNFPNDVAAGRFVSPFAIVLQRVNGLATMHMCATPPPFPPQARCEIEAA